MAADSDKTMMRVAGLVLLVGGAGFAYWGYQMSHSFVTISCHNLAPVLPHC